LEKATLSKPEVFIIESLELENEKLGLFEGRILSQILHLSDKESIYYYIRTKRELEEIVLEFQESNYRYLHISCHGNEHHMYTTLDEIPFKDLARILRPSLRNRRLFLSACLMTNRNLAEEIIPGSGCYSILGPAEDIKFKDATIFWASFYHLMFEASPDSMRRTKIRKNAQNAANLFDIQLYYFNSSKDNTTFSETPIHPQN
jgi:hypothetical protein